MTVNGGSTVFGFGADVAPWTPRNMGGVVLWLRADHGSASGATDLTGNGHDALQATAGNQPTYEAAGFRGRPSWLFDGVDNYFSIADHADLDVGAGSFLCVMAGEWLRTANYEVAWGKGSAATADNIRLFRIPAVGRIVIAWGSDAEMYGSGDPDAQAQDAQTLFGWGLDGVNEIIINDATEERPRVVVPSGTGSNAADVRIGCDTSGTYPTNFRLAECVFVKRGASAIPTGDVQQLLNYLKSYWGL